VAATKYNARDPYLKIVNCEEAFAGECEWFVVGQSASDEMSVGNKSLRHNSNVSKRDTHASLDKKGTNQSFCASF
jgi:hypothetical protein